MTLLLLGGIAAALVGIVLLLIPFKRAGEHRRLAWRNADWAEDIQDLRFVSAAGVLACCGIGGLLIKQLLGL